ncbi:MAG: hypothetical protein SNJ70_09815 [Armatimonadota bacterium]
MLKNSNSGNSIYGNHTNSIRENSNASVADLIASATAYLFQGKLDDALNEAKYALTFDPKNSRITLLIGSIYEQMGNYDSALMFYRFTLELDPSYTEAILKLKKLEDRKEEVSILPSDGVKSEKNKNTGTKLILGFGIFLLLLIIIMIPILAHKKARDAAQTEQVNMQQNFQTVPENNQGVLQYPSGDVRSGSPQQPNADTKQKEAVETTKRTPAESLILNSISEKDVIKSNKLRVYEAVADPRLNSVILSVGITVNQSLTQTVIIRFSYAVAEAAFDSHKDINSVTVRIVLESEGSTPMIGFVGDISRNTFEQLPKDASSDQLLTAFTKQWWNPYIAER